MDSVADEHDVTDDLGFDHFHPSCGRPGIGGRAEEAGAGSDEQGGDYEVHLVNERLSHEGGVDLLSPLDHESSYAIGSEVVEKPLEVDGRPQGHDFSEVSDQFLEADG